MALFASTHIFLYLVGEARDKEGDDNTKLSSRDEIIVKIAAPILAVLTVMALIILFYCLTYKRCVSCYVLYIMYCVRVCIIYLMHGNVPSLSALLFTVLYSL